MNLFRSLTILSIEQATTLPYMTLRFAQEGARVIRVEAPPRGDPNRWVGTAVLPSNDPSSYEQGMNAYFLPNNLGKQSITLNLRSEAGRNLLHRLVRELPVDIFATNQRPGSYEKLGIDFATLSRIKPDLIWVGITGFGPQSNEAAYDPILQARAGLMALTGEPDASPMVFGLPMVDLGAGEHAYGQVMKALYQRAVVGKGSRVDISMLQSAVSWMISPVMLWHSFDIPSTRHGNTHQFFAPVSVYPTRDGFVYLAVGNDRQWQAITELPGFTHLARPDYAQNAGRIEAVQGLNAAITAVTSKKNTADLITQFNQIGVPISRVNQLPDVCADPLIADNLVYAHDAHSQTKIAISPPPVIPEFLREQQMELSFPPRLGEHNERLFGGIGCDVSALQAEGVI
ncbi:MAG: CoA transferase [Chloroflexi bacterium]|nr:MAG: CoA transferase [Chloroflexota bacterium]